MGFGIYLKQLKRIVTTLRKLQPPGRPLNDVQLEKSLGRALKEAESFDLNGLVEALRSEQAIVSERLEAAMEHRRENLLGAARDSGMPHKRFADYDRVGPFKVVYRGTKTSLQLGSEPVCDLEDTEGAVLFERIQQALSELEHRTFEREAFFHLIKSALRLARDDGHDRDGWVPVRSLYTYVALLQNLRFDDFVGRPTARSFHDYTTAQFAYDLARFGRDRWSCGEESLRAQTPNMATVSSGKAMTLPDLATQDRPGTQFAMIRIERGGTRGAETGSGTAS